MHDTKALLVNSDTDETNNVSVQSNYNSEETPSIDIIQSKRVKSKWRSIRICYVVMFFTSISYSIQMPSLWPYMTTINQNYTKQLLGWIVAAYSIGQLIGCPLFSLLSGYFNRFKLILIGSCIIGGMGNYLYAIIRDLPGGQNISTIMLISSRALIGFAGGNVASIRLFLSVSTTDEERLAPMATMSACQAIGFILGPGLQALFVLLGYPGHIQIPFFTIDTYTASAFFSVGGNIAQILFLICCFSDGFLNSSNSESESYEEEVVADDSSNLPSLSNSPNGRKNQYALAVFMMLAFFMCMMSLSILETVITPMCMDNFGWSKSTATLVTSIALAGSGVLSLIVFILVRIVTKYIRESLVLVVAFVLILLSTIALIPFGNYHIPIASRNLFPAITTHHIVPVTTSVSSITTPTFSNDTTIADISTEALPDLFTNSIRNNTHNSTSYPTGCNLSHQPWCLYVPALRYWQLGVAIFLFTLGYPCGNILSYVIFSRIIDPRSQSLWMGLLTACGCLARIIGPLLISMLYHNYGTQIAFGGWSCLILLFLMSTPWFLSKMIGSPCTRSTNQIN